MTDQKQIITGLQEVAAYFRSSFDAMYGTVACEKFRRWTDAIEQALALLKAQEPVEPKKNDVELAGLRTWDWACPECGCVLIYRANYCSCCGRRVKWK